MYNILLSNKLLSSMHVIWANFLQKTSNDTFFETFAVVAMQTCTPEWRTSFLREATPALSKCNTPDCQFYPSKLTKKKKKKKIPYVLMLNFHCFVLFNAVKTDTKLALSKKKKVSCFSDSQPNFRCALTFKKTVLHVTNLQFSIRIHLQTMSDTFEWLPGLPSVYSKSSIYRINIDENKIISEWPPKLLNTTGWAFTTNQCRCVWPKKYPCFHNHAENIRVGRLEILFIFCQLCICWFQGKIAVLGLVFNKPINNEKHNMLDEKHHN